MNKFYNIIINDSNNISNYNYLDNTSLMISVILNKIKIRIKVMVTLIYKYE
jgi:hypothetical protein